MSLFVLGAASVLGAHASPMTAPDVTVTMFSDAQCPCSAQFVADVKYLLDQPQFGAVDFVQYFEPKCNDAVPHCKKVQPDPQLFECIHGDEECLGHRYFLCAQKLAVGDGPVTYRAAAAWLDFQACSYGACMQCDVFTKLACLTPCTTYTTFTKPDKNDIMKNCAAQVGLDWGALQSCAAPNSTLGQQLQIASARECIDRKATYGTRGLPVVDVGATRLVTAQAVPLFCGPTPIEFLQGVCSELQAQGTAVADLPPACASTPAMCQAIANSSRIPACNNQMTQ
jgi:hypothetical protein